LIVPVDVLDDARPGGWAGVLASARFFCLPLITRRVGLLQVS